MSIKRGVKVTAVAVAMGMVISSAPAGVVQAAGKVQLSRTATTLYVGDSETLALLNTTKKQDKNITWNSTKKAVVTVSQKGKITAKKAGTAYVKAKLQKKTYSCKVTVKKPVVSYVEVTPTPADQGNQIYQNDVNQAMTTAAYWYGKRTDADEVLMDREAILHQNELNAVKTSGMTDFKNGDVAFNSDQSKTGLLNELMDDVRVGRIGSHETIWRNGVELDKEAIDTWFASMKKNVEDAVTSPTDTRKYGICVRRGDMWMAPTNALVGWSKTDPDSEFINSSVNVNEPLLIGVTTADGKYCHVKSLNCSGWMETDHIAICDSKDEWLAQWDLAGRDDVLVVTDSHITLEESDLAPKTSKLDLYLGTQLPLVPQSAVTSVNERTGWYSYSVYIPTREADGKLGREVALISSHHRVSIGFPQMTIKNILTIAFNCLGDRYGWGGMLGAMDCSLYTRNIYRCFGLEIARNTSGQVVMPTARIDMTDFTEDQKSETIAGAIPGSLLMFPGHITMVLGEDNGKLYVISDMGSAIESGSDGAVQSIYSVSINSLDLRRKNGNTWLHESKWLVMPFIADEA